MTPRMYDTLTQQWMAREQRRDRRAAVTATVLANINRRKGARAFTIEDFMPHRWETRHQDAAPAAHERTPEEEVAHIESWVKAMGGTVNPPAGEAPSLP
jgi:hypothetical protein